VIDHRERDLAAAPAAGFGAVCSDRFSMSTQTTGGADAGTCHKPLVADFRHAGIRLTGDHGGGR
jgi:hypothetical protein